MPWMMIHRRPRIILGRDQSCRRRHSLTGLGTGPVLLDDCGGGGGVDNDRRHCQSTMHC